jgi:hypothetical protein
MGKYPAQIVSFSDREKRRKLHVVLTQHMIGRELFDIIKLGNVNCCLKGENATGTLDAAFVVVLCDTSKRFSSHP